MHPVQTNLTTWKLKSCFPSLKSSFDKDLNSHVVYELTCNGCKSIYVGQTCRHNTTKVAVHAKADSSMGIHATEWNEDKTDFQGNILDQCDSRSALYKKIETGNPRAQRIPNMRIDTEKLVWG